MNLNHSMFHSQVIKIIAIAVVIVLAGFIIYLLCKEEPSLLPVQEKEEIDTTLKDAGAGDFGEVTVQDEDTGKEVPLIDSNVPKIIFNTAGAVKEVRPDRLIVGGNGSNFADGRPRNLTLVFTSETLTIGKGESFRCFGEECLKHFKSGMKVSISSDENIRGKVKFKVKKIKIL